MNAAKLSFLTAVTLGALVALAPTSRAEDTKEPAKPETPAAGQRQRRAGANQFEALAERLKLTDEQKTKLQPIYREENTKLRELRQENLKPDEMRAKVKTIREEYLGKMKPALTTEQYDQLKKIREQGTGRAGPRGVRQGGDAKPPTAPDEKK